MLGFMVVDPSLRPDTVNKLKINAHPPSASLVSVLEKSPPHTQSEARLWFELLASRLPGMNLFCAVFNMIDLKFFFQIFPLRNY